MTYALGIDVGTSFTAAAVCRRDGESWGAAEAVGLGTRSTATASVVFLRDDGEWLVGDAADRRAHTEPDRVIREFKRRLGDPVPIVVGGQRQRSEAIAATVVHWVIERVAEQEGSPPAAITITHPASWGRYKLSLFEKAVADVSPSPVTFVSEPVAAAAHYASLGRVGAGSAVAVYDLGGGTFDAAIVRKTPAGSFELLGVPQGIDRLGGMDFDEAVYGHLRAGTALPAADPGDPDAVAAMIRLRRECTEAKEALSDDTEATIPVLLPQVRTRVRLVRAEFEDLIHDAIAQTVEALRMTIESADIDVSDIDAVLLVGGSSRVPLVAQLVSAQLDRPVVVDADPKAAIALGAAFVAAADLDAVAAVPPGAGELALVGVNGSDGATGATLTGRVRPTRRKVRVLSGAAALAIAIAGTSAVALVWPPASTESGRFTVDADDVPAREIPPGGDTPTETTGLELTRRSSLSVPSTTVPRPPGVPLIPIRDSSARPAATSGVGTTPSSDAPPPGQTSGVARRASGPSAPAASTTSPPTPAADASPSPAVPSPTTTVTPSTASGPTSNASTTPRVATTPPAPATTAGTPAPAPTPAPTTVAGQAVPDVTVAPAPPPPVVTEPPPTVAVTPPPFEPTVPAELLAEPAIAPDPEPPSVEPAADATANNGSGLTAEAPTDEGAVADTTGTDGPL